MWGRRHAVLSTAIGTEELNDLAEILHTELVTIDNATTSRGFTRELRWNQVYYRVAQGL